jgi:hypothetical protein
VHDNLQKNFEFPERCCNLIQFIQLSANIGAVLSPAILITDLDRCSRPITGTKGSYDLPAKLTREKKKEK